MSIEPIPLQEAYKRYRRIFASIVVFSLAINVLLFVGPIYMLQVYDRVLASRSELTLLMITGICVGLLVAYGLLEFLRSLVFIRAGAEFDKTVSMPVFFNSLSASIDGGRQNAAATLRELDKLREFLSGSGLAAFFDVPWVPIFLGMCFLFHPLIGLVALTGAIVIFALAILNEFATRKKLQDATRQAIVAGNFADGALANADVVKALGMQSQLVARWNDARQVQLKEQARASDSAAAILSTSKFVRMVLQIAILGVGALLVIEGEVTPGIMIASSIMMGRALSPVEQIVAQWKQVVAARMAHDKLKKLLSAYPSETSKIALPRAVGQLDVQGLTSFAPGTQHRLLTNVSFSLQPGETLAIVGASGSGKSTLLRHLVGVWSAAAGTVRLDGNEFKNWREDELGAQIGYLPQEVRLFSGTVAENIARFDPEFSSEKVIAAATLAGANALVQSFPGGYATELGDGGNQLSGGQRQRIGLSRAIYGEPALIVLDEPNANLDSEGETALFNCLSALKQMKKTVIVVTHKANLLSLADKTLVMANGSVQAFGPTQEIFSANGATKIHQRSA